MRPTTKRRVIILAVSAVLSSAGLVGVYQFRQSQINAKTMAHRAEGMEAFEQGDYARALIPLSKYNERRQTDVETLFAFGKARSRVEAPNGRHLIESIQYYRRGLELDPSNQAARHELLELYSNAGYNGEAITLADELLKKDAKDVAAVRAKAKALAARRQHAEALATSLQLNELAPLDVDGQGLTLFLMSPWCLNQPASDILARAKKLLDAHPDDPRFVLLQGYAYKCVLDDVKAREWYQKAAANPPADPEFIKFCTNLMDGVGMFDDSQKLLERASADGKDPRMTRMLVQRLWQNGRFPQVVDRLKGLDAATTASDSQLLAYKAYSLYQLQRPQEAKPVVDALAGRKDDDVAIAWAKALSAKFDDPAGNPRDKVTQYQAALVRDPSNPVIRYLLGEAYARLGETELALTNWNAVVRDVPSWATPRVEMAYLLASTGRTQTAVEQAAAAYSAGRNLGSAIGLVVALATQLENGSAQQPNVAKLLELAAEIQQKVPGEPQTLPIYVNLLAKTGEKEKAAAVINETIKAGHPIGTDAWMRLASVSRSNKLGLERTVMDHAQKVHGLTPSVALANAVLMAESGEKEPALQYLNEQAAKATDNPAGWKLVVARFREHARDPKAHDAWVALGDEFTDNLTVQSAILDLPDSSTAWQDRPFIERTVQRLKALTGEQGFHWQLAEARWLLNSPNPKRDSAKAVVTLSELVRGSPGLVVPRIYLARAMENVENTPAAIEQLRAAAEMDRENVAVALDLVRLYQADGKFADAKVYLDRAAKAAVDPRSRRRLADFYARQGDLDAAVKVLGPAAGAADADPNSAVLVADLHRRRGDFDQAAKLFQQVASHADADAASVAAAADFFAARGQTDQSRKALDRLAKMTLPAGHREAILADHAEKHGTKQEAEGLYRKAVDAAPTDPAIWRQLAAFQMRQNQFDEAAATCDQALAKLPGNEELASMKNQALALRTTGGAAPDTEALVAELSKDPRNAAARDSLATYNEIRKNNDPPDRAVAKMRRVADQYPRFLPVQTQVVRMYAQQGMVAEAIGVAARAMENFPTDPEAASLATMVYAGTGRWKDVLSSAREWRKRSLENPMQPDLMTARAQLELGQPAQAMATLKPYMAAAGQDPDKYNMVVGTYAHALIADGRDAEAGELLRPHLKRSEEWAISSLRLARLIRNPASAARWIEQIAPAVPADSLRAQYEVANAWYALAIRQNGDQAMFARAREVITPLTQRPDVTAPVMQLAGSIAEYTNQPSVAIDAYRRALQIDPRQPLTQNNLAYLLLANGGDMEEAQRLAEQAVEASRNDASYNDTLARIYEKVGKTDRAIAAYQKVLDIEPTNVHAMVPTIRLLSAQGQREAARAMMTKLEALLQSNPALRTPDLDVESLRKQL